MDRKDLQEIENQIGYHFQNSDLLQQAFVRRSYSRENGGENNEVLEFIGDKVLDFVVVKLLSEKYGYYLQDCEDYNPQEDCNEFACEYRENKLTEFKKKMVCKETLAERIDSLYFADYLILGNGDQKNHIDQQASVKEDLFEAILGAVALDSNWNLQEMQTAVEMMLNPEQYLEEGQDNYVQEIQEWTAAHSDSLPSYRFGSSLHTSFPVYNSILYFSNTHPKCIYDPDKLRELRQYPVCCYMSIAADLPEFWGLGNSKSEARKDACIQAYHYLEKEDMLFTIQNEIEDPNEDQSINQLETLARRGYFSLPTYCFQQNYDEDGNPVWYCECHIEEYEDFYRAEASSKKGAKKSAAYGMLLSVLE